MKHEPTVFIVDDDIGIRRSAGMLLQAAGFRVETFESGSAFLEECTLDHAGCIIVDLSMPGMSGIDMIERLRAQHIILPVLIVTGTGTILLAVQGMKLGAVDFLEKPAAPDELIARVRIALELDAKQRANASDIAPIRQRLASLTAREQEILKLLVQGQSNKQIASTLSISGKTVDNHRTRVMKKTGALNAADLVRMTLVAGEPTKA